MRKAQCHAPIDHFSPHRAALTELSARLLALRDALPLRRRLAGGLHLGVMAALAALLAYLPTNALGLKQPFWSAITAIAVVQAEFHATESTARDQFVGALIGGSVALVALLIWDQNLLVYAVAVVVAMAACWAVNFASASASASASRLAGSTATIILLVPRDDSAVQMFGARIAEVGWGVAVAVGIVWLAGRLPLRK